MELKVWVDGAVRVVCGLSLDTSCQNVVIALAQAIGQTGRYVLIMKFQGNERPVSADDYPLQLLAQLGQLASQVQFVLRRTGPSLSEGPHKSTKEKLLPLLGPSEPEPVKHKGPQKALTFNTGPSTLPRRSKVRKTSCSSLLESSEPPATPVTPADRSSSMNALSSGPPKEEVLRDILQQQQRLHDLEAQIEALEMETDFWEQKITSALVSDRILSLAKELEELEFRLKQNEVELMYGENWEEELKVEMEREQEMERRLQQIQESIDDQSQDIKVHQSHSAQLEQELQVTAQTDRQSAEEASRQTDKALRSLTEELYNRLQLGEELDSTLSDTQWELQTAEERVKDRMEVIEGLNKELRQCNLQQFIQKAGVPLNTEQKHSLPVKEVYLRKDRIRK